MLNSSTAWTNEIEGARYIKKGEVSPTPGILLPEETAIKVRYKLIEAKQIEESYEKSIKLYKQNEAIYEQKEKTLLEQNDKLAVQLKEARESTQLEKILYFFGGVLLSGAAVYGASKLAK